MSNEMNLASTVLTDERIAAGGRWLCDQSADACGVNRDDNWKTYGNEYTEEFRGAALAAFGVEAVAAQAGQVAVPDDPMDSGLPCDIKVGNVTIRKGCKLRTLVARMESLHRMAMAALPVVTPEQRAEFDSMFPRFASISAAAPSPAKESK